MVKYYRKGRELKIIIFRHNEKIIGIMPVFWERIGFMPLSVRVVKIVGTDFMPITLKIPLQNGYIDQLINLFFNEINRDWCWDIIHFGGICGRYDSIDTLKLAFDRVLINSHYIR